MLEGKMKKSLEVEELDKKLDAVAIVLSAIYSLLVLLLLLFMLRDKL